MLNFFFLSHFLVVDVAIVTVDSLTLFILLGLFAAIGELLIKVGLIFVELINLLLLLFSLLLGFVLQLLVEGIHDITADDLSTLFLLYF
jgi:hypothetical protein